MGSPTETKTAKDEAAVVRELRALRQEEGGTGHGRLVVEVRDDRVQVVEATKKIRLDRGRPMV